MRWQNIPKVPNIHNIIHYIPIPESVMWFPVKEPGWNKWLLYNLPPYSFLNRSYVSFINIVFCEYLTDSSAEKAELLDALIFRSLWRMQTHDNYFPFQITRPSLTSTTTFPSIFPASWTSLIWFPSIPDVDLTSESDNFTCWECWDASAASSCINGWGPFHIFSAHLCSRSASVSRFGAFEITSA